MAIRITKFAIRAWSVSVLLILVPSLSFGDTTGSALLEFGLEGHWSADCADPPSNTNPHIYIELPSTGDPSIRTVVTGGSVITPILDAKLTDRKLVLKRQFNTNMFEATMESVQVKVGSKIQTADLKIHGAALVTADLPDGHIERDQW